MSSGPRAMPGAESGEPRVPEPGPCSDARAFGRYHLFAKLGSGGQADVFLAVARGTLGVDKLVVIKRARAGLAEDAAQLGDFLDEARFSLRLNHPNLVHTYEVGQECGLHFLSMEHIEGLSLKELFDSPRAREFPAAIWVRIVADALSGLAHVHGLRDYDGKPMGIVHRDVSPHNILVSYDGVTKVLDFGIAKSSARGVATEVGALTGKLAYMAPEQVRGSADRRSDLFAVGVVLWEMISGRRLHEGSAASIQARLHRDVMPRLSEVVPEVDPELDELVARALAREPDERFQSANEMRQALERYLRRAGHVVREHEVSEVLTVAFHDERSLLRAHIQEAMAEVSTPARAGAELPGLTEGQNQLGAAAQREVLDSDSAALASVEIAAPEVVAVGSSPLSAVALAPDALVVDRSPVTTDESAAPSRSSDRESGALHAPVAARSRLAAATVRARPGTEQLARALGRLRDTRGGRWLGAVTAVSMVLLLGWRAVRGIGGSGAGSSGGAAAGRQASSMAACTAPLRVRVMFDMTGATRGVGTTAGKGELDYLRALQESGGLGGCPIDIDVQDTRYDKATALAVYRAWKARADWPEVSTIFLQGTPMTQILGPLAAEDDKVIISGAYAGELGAPLPTAWDVEVPSLSDAFAAASVSLRKQSNGYSHVFFQGTDYTTAARVAATFVWRQGGRRMAFFYCSTSAFCTDPVDGAKTFLAHLGSTQIGRDLAIELDDTAAEVERKVLRFFEEEQRRAAAHADYQPVDWIWFGNTSANTAALGPALVKVRQRLGLEVQVIGNNWSVDESLHQQCGTPCTGFYVVQPFAPFGDASTRGTAALLADHAAFRARDGEPADAHRTVQYVYGRVAVATWRIAAERILARGERVTGASLRAELERFRNVDVEGFATVGYTPTDHRPQAGARVARLAESGALELVGQPVVLALQPSWLGW